ncbi:centrosomal protein of 70 kDa-like, partial [Saccoglossus kowalevskii]|uniref:Centrosomal protein of 70 kDa n=1 Tax=Saccoglossus kowalevskii TaxID=10224 RepID=A0ABM0MWM0_SACKO
FDFDEWSGVNKLLRQHGLPTITLTDPNRISDIADIVVFESSVARLIRENLMSLIHDNDRRQEIIQDLIMSNNQIKSDIERSSIHIRRLEDEKQDLEILLDNARDSIQELKDKHLAQLRHHDNTAEMLRLSRETTETRCKHIEEKYNKQEDELNRLKRKLRMVVEAEESRIERQNEIFQQYRNKGSRAHSTADQRHEARMYRDANIGKRVDRYDALSPLPDDTLTYDNRGLSLAGHNGRWSVDTDPVPNYKAVVK